MAEEKKVDTSIIDNEMKKEAITDESDNKFGKFNNKYVKGAIAAIITAYAAKQDPYMLKGFTEKVEEFDKADRENRSKYIEASATGIGRILAQNAAKRKERIADYSDKINQLTVYTKDKYKAASMIKSGLYTQMLAKAVTGTDINSLFKITTEFDNSKGDLTTSELAELLSGPSKRLDEKFAQFNAPRAYNPVSRFIGGDESDDVTKEVMSQTKALTPESFTEENDVEGIITQADLAGGLTARGKRFLQKAPKGDFTATKTSSAINQALIKALGGSEVISLSSSGEKIYSYKSEIEGRTTAAASIELNVSALVNKLMNNEQFDRTTATSLVIGPKITDEKDPLYSVSQEYSLDLGNKNSDYKPIRDILGKKVVKINPTIPSLTGKNKAKSLLKTATTVLTSLKTKLDDAKKNNTTVKQTGSGYNRTIVDTKKVMIAQTNIIAQGVASLTKAGQMFENKPAEARAYIKKQLNIK